MNAQAQLLQIFHSTRLRAHQASSRTSQNVVGHAINKEASSVHLDASQIKEATQRHAGSSLRALSGVGYQPYKARDV